MTRPPDAAECRRRAEEAELMARTVSYRPDRERYVAEARRWRRLEAEATEAERRRREPGAD